MHVTCHQWAMMWLQRVYGDDRVSPGAPEGAQVQGLLQTCCGGDNLLCVAVAQVCLAAACWE